MNETAQVETDEVAEDQSVTEATETEASKEPKAKKKVTGVSQDAKITILAKSNPKRAGSASYDRFQGYLTEKAPATVKEALENGLIIGDIHYDLIHGSIEVEGATVVEYQPTARGPNAEKAEGDDAVENELDEGAGEVEEGTDGDGF